TAKGFSYAKAYLRVRRSDEFDAEYYLSRYPDVSHAGLNPLMHYVEHGRREGRQPVGSGLEPAALNISSPTSAEALLLPPPLASKPESSAPAGRVEEARPGDYEFAAKLENGLAGHVPESAVIAVASGGDENLLSLPGYRTLPFPRGSDGTYGGDAARGN